MKKSREHEMVHIWLKNKKFIQFKMATPEAEQNLVSRFLNKMYPAKSVLDFKDKGQIPVSEIEAMDFFVPEEENNPEGKKIALRIGCMNSYGRCREGMVFKKNLESNYEASDWLFLTTGCR